jgi:hypothetical protein
MAHEARQAEAQADAAVHSATPSDD